MEIAAIDKKLKKIITVFDAFKADNKISHLERDLLLGYLRDIYELVLNDDEIETNLVGTNEIKSTSPKLKTLEEMKFALLPEVSQNIDVQSIISSSINQKEEIAKVADKIILPTAEQKIEEPNVSIIAEDSTYSPFPSNPMVNIETPPLQITVPENVPVIKIEDSSVVTTYEVEVNKSTSSSAFTENEKLAKLFIINRGSDISEKLAMSPIADIGKFMGLNERMFTLTELFSGDSNLFNKTINELNGLSSFEEAKSYLTNHIASHQKWDDEAKWDKAHNFIKLVRRRYPA